MKNALRLLGLMGLLIGFYSCEQEFIPDLPESPEEIVVEGYIEAGELALPSYVILTRSLPFFSELPVDELGQLFIHDAEVIISHDAGTTILEEVCWSDFDEDEQAILQEILNSLGLFTDGLAFDFCVYVDINFDLTGEEGKQYDLTVRVGEEELKASTTIPFHVPMDSLKFKKPVGTVADTLLELRGFISDPAGQANFYRYLTSTNNDIFQPGFNSVSDDLFFDGQSFEFPLPKGEARNINPNPRTFGLYTIGDTTTIRWCNIDDAHYRFWSTLEFNAVNQGPFSSYTRVDTNIEGGLGIWGGYSVSYYSLIVKE